MKKPPEGPFGLNRPNKNNLTLTLQELQAMSHTYNEQKLKFVHFSVDGEGTFAQVSPIVINKALQGAGGEPANVKKLKDGTLLVECVSDNQAKNLVRSRNTQLSLTYPQ